MPKHPDDFRDTDLGDHPFDAQLHEHLGSPLHIDASRDAWRRREARRFAVMGAVCIGSILIGMLLGLFFFCNSLEVRDRLEAQLYGERV